MSHRRIGQLLSSIVPITEQDVEEILEEQHITHRRFGEIALAWGLCTPAHVWEAWARQAHDTLLLVDLVVLGIDAQAVEHLSRETAERLGAIVIRSFETLVVVALKDASIATEVEHELQHVQRRVSFVLASCHQIDEAIVTYYAPVPVDSVTL